MFDDKLEFIDDIDLVMQPCRGRCLHRPVPKYTIKLQRVAVGSDPYVDNHIGYFYNCNAVPTFCTLRFAFCTL